MRSKKFHLSNKVKITATAMAVVVSAASVIPSFAADSTSTTTDETLVPTTTTTATANASTGEVAQDIAAAQTECADLTNTNGLAAAAAAAYQDRNKLASASPNIDKLFDIAEDGGCFSALKDFPNLSVAIPSLSSIASALQQTLIKYATRKVCQAVNEALSEVIDPVNEAIGEISKNGEIDLAGVLNKEMVDQAYKIDPELGRVTTGAKSTEYTLEDVYSGSTSSNSTTTTTNGAVTAQSSTNTEDSTSESGSKNLLDLLF